MSVLEEIGAKASQLPPELQAEVLDFIQFLDYKKVKKQPIVADPFPDYLIKGERGKRSSFA